MNAALVEKMNEGVKPTAGLAVFYLDLHQRYLELAEYALDGGFRRCAMGYFDIVCAYMRLAVQKSV